MPDKMGYVLTPIQKADINTALDTVLSILNSVKTVQLKPEERVAAQSASETRLPYIEMAIKELAPAYTNLQPPFLSLADASNDLQMSFDLRSIITRLAEVSDRYVDFSLASEHFAYEYMRKYYAIAQEGQGVNTPGADTSVNALSPLFEGQGEKNVPAPNP